MESKVYNQSGKEVGKVDLPEKIFGVSWNDAFMHQVIVSMMGNLRTPVAHAKTRGEVSGTGKKPWRQKGTGRARHGSRRSPIWVGGGVAHGPRKDRDYSRKVNKKMRDKALFAVLSRKVKDKELILVDNISVAGPKTALAKKMLNSLSAIEGYNTLNRRRNVAYLAIDGRKDAVEKSFRNFGNLKVNDLRNINVLDVMKYKYLIIENPDRSFGVLTSRIKK